LRSTRTSVEPGAPGGIGEGVGRGDGTGDGDGEGNGAGKRVGEGVGESAGEDAGMEGEGLESLGVVATGFGPQPAPSRRAATAMPAKRRIPLILVLSNDAVVVRLRVARSELNVGKPHGLSYV
jgi:hypothetical protein